MPPEGGRGAAVRLYLSVRQPDPGVVEDVCRVPKTGQDPFAPSNAALIGKWPAAAIKGRSASKILETRLRMLQHLLKSCAHRVQIHLRHQRLRRIGWSPDGTAEAVTWSLVGQREPLKRLMHTVTCDRGTEFAGDRAVEKQLNVRVYFSNPCSPWQRGCNENFNGLLRQFFR